MSESPEFQRCEVAYSGLVQGVGFRYSARQIAQRFAVTGYAQNLADGRVRLVAEGDRRELERFLGAVAQAMAENIHGAETIESPATGEFQYFGIHH
jgi:acylphosphatase